jgi:OOP family OmpA-OmpF porin
LYTVWVGNDDRDEAGRIKLEGVANAGACGFATTATEISTPSGMNQFVKKVFLKTVECAVRDDDQDGVNNCSDKCPDTPKGAVVDKNGCWAFHGVLFDFDSDKIKSKYDPMIDNAVKVLKMNPGLTVEIQGHTDSYGSEAYNLDLSNRRANSVKQELMNHGIDGKRMTTVGFGESQPVESNETDEGRAFNRRVAYKRTDK